LAKRGSRPKRAWVLDDATAQLRAAGHERPARVLELWRSEIDEPAEQARVLGCSVDEIYNARKVVRRYLEKRPDPRAMTDKRSPQETLDVIEESADSDEAERILALSDEALDQELRAEGFDPKAVRARGAALAARLGIEASAPAATAPTPLAKRVPRRWVAWLAAATFALVAVTLAGMNVDAIVAMFKGGGTRDIGLDDAALWAVAHGRAEKLRDDAEGACQRKLWGACEASLDEAQKIDAAGEEQERVQRLRKRIDEAAHAEAGPEKKRLGP
jgi:hypothetical protein